jgi:hypothetical protein
MEHSNWMPFSTAGTTIDLSPMDDLSDPSNPRRATNAFTVKSTSYFAGFRQGWMGTGTSSETPPTTHVESVSMYALTGTITNASSALLLDMQTKNPDGYVVYLGFSDFAFSSHLTPPGDYIREVLELYLANIVHANCKGVILDVRGNDGGADADLPILISPLLTSDLTWASVRQKNGDGRYDYLPWQPRVIPSAPPPPVKNYYGIQARAANAGNIPVVAIGNDWSISNGDFLTMVAKAMPHGCFVGTRTYGATGSRIDGPDSQAYPNPMGMNAGSFTVTVYNIKLLTVVEAGQQTRGLNGENYEGVGVEPDKTVEMVGDLDTPDEQLNAALSHINEWWAAR